MEKPDGSSVKEAWGTWEELLLAFAVNRYGTASWESVSLEIQKRSSNLTSPFLTPSNCKLRFNDLKRRYTDCNQDDTVGDQIIPWLDELRNRRIAELKSELERYDLSIVSLQLKMKRLKEEREESDKLEKLSPEAVIDKSVAGDELHRDLKIENLENYEVKPENDNEPVETWAAPVSAIRTESFNGSSESIVKEIVKIEAEVGQGELIQVCETVAESKKIGEKESSDVQSTTSRLMKEENDRLHCGAGRESRSLLLKEMSSISQPFIEFLEILQSYKLGLVSEMLLDSQVNSNYRNLIRQHIDIKSVYRNVKAGCYLDCGHKFFRDLLLLVNNAILVFDKNSSESNASTELRQLISEKMAQRNSEAVFSAGKQSSVPPISLLSKQAQEPYDSLLSKPHIDGIITVSRKRSSFAAKGSASSSGSDRKSFQTAALAKHKPVQESKQTKKSSAADRRRQITKRTGNGASFSSRSSKKNSKDLASTTCDEYSVVLSNKAQGKLGSPTEPSHSKGEKNPASTEVKKPSASNFLDRFKQSPPSDTEPFIDAWKNSLCSPHQIEGGKSEHKGSGSIKGGNRKYKVTKRSCEGKILNEESSLARRQLRRPPKRAAAAPTPLLTGSGTCSRAIGDIDAEAPKQPKKRSRK